MRTTRSLVAALLLTACAAAVGSQPAPSERLRCAMPTKAGHTAALQIEARPGGTSTLFLKGSTR